MRHVKRALTIGLLATVAAVAWQAPAFKVATAAPGANPYPYGSSTYWAWQNRTDLPGNLGEAKSWDNNGAAQGWPVGSYPRTGDVAVFEPNVLGADSRVGRVAVVRQVFDNGTYSATQMDDADCRGGGNCGRVNTRQYRIVPGTSFIHYVKDSRTTWGFASGAAGWTPINLGLGMSEGSGWRYPLASGKPELVSPDLEIPLDAYDAIQVEMIPSKDVTATGLQVSFATAAQAQFSAARTVGAATIADGLPHTYTLFLGSNAQWRGTLTRLALHPAGTGSRGSIRIDRIKLIYAKTTSKAPGGGF
ncbi:MAG: CHAP domain-containing protein [Chloroflexia bacterium]